MPPAFQAVASFATIASRKAAEDALLKSPLGQEYVLRKTAETNLANGMFYLKHFKETKATQDLAAFKKEVLQLRQLKEEDSFLPHYTPEEFFKKHRLPQLNPFVVVPRGYGIVLENLLLPLILLEEEKLAQVPWQAWYQACQEAGSILEVQVKAALLTYAEALEDLPQGKMTNSSFMHLLKAHGFTNDHFIRLEQQIYQGSTSLEEAFEEAYAHAHKLLLA